ncbi:COG4315 family predicted lipoprotein [Streptomyces sediminimaris]|uniref:COG4315 family predicted lipoprotein n=1 Tax=Streptomyces sediminimaris TaxID=3383721 RepID=UPI00399BE507
MNRAAIIAATATAVAAFAAGCGSSGATGSSSPAKSPSPPPSSSTPATGGSGILQSHGSPVGQILVDGSGRTLYLFKADSGTTSHCYGSCAQAWPPDITTGHPSNHGLKATMVGTAPRHDHTTQVTYNGHPLYRFSQDAGPGDTTGQSSTAFGGAWYVVSPSGTPITSPAPSPSSGGSGGGYTY